ncbi:murein hydrolase activator EnvC [Prevotella sp. 10(H)]|uniref:murein hydrolase activator EnvC family protein n=1 Tax=Prevotella sp. 10(H) TaxID=1158294 RepID=UPI0004A6F7DF|nr:peptidoglycan DD-metalloendopeptidase family protein [Prevotella sp. 10(H)]
MRSLVLLFVLLLSISSFAQNNKIKQLEQQRKNALRDISNTDKILKETKKSTSTLLSRIQLISNQMFSRQKVLDLLNQEINGIDAEQKNIESEVLILESELKSKQSNYAKAIDGMLQNRQSENKILFVLSGRSLTESYRRLRYLRDYSEWRQQQATEIKDKSVKLKERKEALAKAKAAKTALLGQRTTEQENLRLEEVNYKKEVTEAQEKQKDLQKILAQKRQQAEALDRQIARLIAEEVARQEREAKRIAAAKAKAAAEAAAKAKAKSGSSKSSGKASTKPAAPVTTENVALSNNFASNKGRLPYPITGNYSITTRFGSHKHSQFVTTSSSGIDIQSQSGAEAKAVFDGEVTYVAAIPGYNTCIIIRHGNYYTFYGNIQGIYVKQGEKVKTGQSLGKVYTDTDTGQSQIHFQLWQGTKKLNPEPWLR